MNNDIKEILDMFTKYKDNWYSVEYILKPKQCVMLLEYITNLQEENERLNNIIEEKKIPEKLKIEQDTPTSNYYIRNENGTKCSLTKHSKMIAETLNQLLDYLKSKGE